MAGTSRQTARVSVNPCKPSTLSASSAKHTIKIGFQLISQNNQIFFKVFPKYTYNNRANRHSTSAQQRAVTPLPALGIGKKKMKIRRQAKASRGNRYFFHLLLENRARSLSHAPRQPEKSALKHSQNHENKAKKTTATKGQAIPAIKFTLLANRDFHHCSTPQKILILGSYH